jgi:hypothetical protein
MEYVMGQNLSAFLKTGGLRILKELSANNGEQRK